MHFLLLFVFALVLALSLSTTANAEPVKEVNEAGDLLEQGPGNFKLMKNIVTSDTWEVSGESSLDLNGYSLRVQTNTSVISVGANAKLTITDSDPSRVNYLTMEGWQGKFVSAEGSETEIDANGDGIVKVEGGFITGGQGKDGILAGGGITVTGGSVQEGISGGNVIMNGGTIIGNNNIVHQDFDYGGAGVFVDARGVFEWKKSGLKKGTAYKAYVKAYVYKNGKKSYVKTSPIVHAYTRNGTKKFTNAKSVSVNKTKVSLKKGKTFKIKAKVKKVKKSRKLMPKGHTAAVRYMTSNSRIATVNSGGRIKAKGKGSCYVYVYAHNGVYKKIKVTVR